MRRRHIATLGLVLLLSAHMLAQQPQLKWVTRVEPVYPQMARIAHIYGEVWVDMELDPQGTIVNLLPLSGHPILIQAARESLTKSKFLCENCTENEIFSVVIRFKIDDPPKAAPGPANESKATAQSRATRERHTQRSRSAKCLFLWRCSSL